MKKTHRLLAIPLLLTLLLTACQQDTEPSTATSQSQESVSSESSSEKEDNQAKESSQTSQAETTKSKTPEEVHQLYQGTLDWYQEIVQLAKNKEIQKATPSDAETSYVVSIINDSHGKDIQYSFYDINKDGQDELILRDKYAIIAIYSLQNDKPVLLKAGGVAGSGGERRILTIYDNGTFIYNNFHSPRPEAHATNYRITPEGQAEEVKQVDYDLQDTRDPAPLLGLDKEKELDIETFAWQALAPTPAKQESAPTTASDPVPRSNHQGLDIHQIQEGDFSTLVGTWRNGNGYEMTIDQNGQAGPNLRVSVDHAKVINNTLAADLIANGPGSAALIIAPAGSQIGDANDSYTDASDHSRDRLIGVQDQSVIESPENFFYRVD